MDARLFGAVVLLSSFIVASCAPPGGGRMQLGAEREAAARERRAREAAQRAAVERPERTEQSRQDWTETGAGRTALQRFLETDGMHMCSLDFQEAQRALFGNRVLMRWSETRLEDRFPWKRPSGSVTTYTGDAVQIRAADGSWTNVVYECDYDHAAEEVVDVRATQGVLR